MTYLSLKLTLKISSSIISTLSKYFRKLKYLCKTNTRFYLNKPSRWGYLCFNNVAKNKKPHFISSYRKIINQDFVKVFDGVN